MSRPPRGETFEVHWRGIHLRINWDEKCFKSAGHLEIVCIAKGAKLPVTETGYRSHFLAPEDMVNRGGPVAYVLAWLDAEAASSDWQKRETEFRQLRLF